MSDLALALQSALDRREALRLALEAEGTDCYRLFWGAVEGRPGLTIDRYGPVALVQLFRGALTGAERAMIERLLPSLEVVVHDRGRREVAPVRAAFIAHELGISHEIDISPGRDPGLFLDLRVGRRWVREHSAGATVLNLFSYTGGVGLAAAVGGAAEVWNVDFSTRALGVSARNIKRNGVNTVTDVQADVLPTLRQLAGLRVGGRGRKRRFRRFEARQFDLVVLDPPTWSTSPFGAVDPVRDYPSLFKPALLATAPGGWVLATNHVSTVVRDDWVAGLRRTADKLGRTLRGVTLLSPEGDFPSPDGQPPLKVAVVEL